MDTIQYIQVNNLETLHKCSDLLLGSGLETEKFGKVVIAAKQGDDIVGVVSVQPEYTNAVVVGPLYVSAQIKYRGLVAFRLISYLEELLLQKGVEVYLFYTDKANTKWLDIIKRLNIPCIGEQDGVMWFKRQMYQSEVN